MVTKLSYTDPGHIVSVIHLQYKLCMHLPKLLELSVVIVWHVMDTNRLFWCATSVLWRNKRNHRSHAAFQLFTLFQLKPIWQSGVWPWSFWELIFHTEQFLVDKSATDQMWSSRAFRQCTVLGDGGEGMGVVRVVWGWVFYIVCFIEWQWLDTLGAGGVLNCTFQWSSLVSGVLVPWKVNLLYKNHRGYLCECLILFTPVEYLHQVSKHSSASP